jgi:hypothetical protein
MHGRICEHRRVLRLCKECGGSSICVHGREHHVQGVRRRQHLRAQGRVRSRCKEYGCARAAADTLDGEDLRRQRLRSRGCGCAGERDGSGSGAGV